MSWVLLLLAEHPDIQERVREEARRTLPPDDSSITMDHADQLVYLNNTVKETLRWDIDMKLNRSHDLTIFGLRRRH